MTNKQIIQQVAVNLETRTDATNIEIDASGEELTALFDGLIRAYAAEIEQIKQHAETNELSYFYTVKADKIQLTFYF